MSEDTTPASSGRLMLADEIQPPTKWYERRREPEAAAPAIDDDAALDEAMVIHMFGAVYGGE